MINNESITINKSDVIHRKWMEIRVYVFLKTYTRIGLFKKYEEEYDCTFES